MMKKSVKIEKKSKIFFVINRLGGKGWGGAHRVSVIVANYLAKKGYDVSIISWYKTQIDYPINELVKIISFNLEKQNEKSRIIACFKTRKVLAKNKGAFVYVFISRMAIDVFLSTLFLKLKIIASERTDPTRNPKYKIFRFIRNQMFCFMYKNVFQTIDSKNYFPKKAQKKGIVIPNPLAPDLIKPYFGERIKKEFVTFCRIDKAKNLFMMIDAFIESHKKHSDFILKIYGNGILENEIKNYIDTHHANAYIIREKFSNNIHDKIKESYAYLSSSDYEGLSNSMLEAMAIGLPCICTDCSIGGAKMVIKNHVNGILVPVKDFHAMSNAINLLIEDKKLYQKIKKNAILIREELSEEKICLQWENLMK